MLQAKTSRLKAHVRGFCCPAPLECPCFGLLTSAIGAAQGWLGLLPRYGRCFCCPVQRLGIKFSEGYPVTESPYLSEGILLPGSPQAALQTRTCQAPLGSQTSRDDAIVVSSNECNVVVGTCKITD